MTSSFLTTICSVLTGTGFNTVEASEALPLCKVTGAAVDPTSLYFKDSTKTYKASETGYVLTNVRLLYPILF